MNFETTISNAWLQIVTKPRCSSGCGELFEGTSLSYSRAGYSQCFPINVLNQNTPQTSPKLLLPYGTKLIVWIERHVAYAKYESMQPMTKE